MATLTLYAPSGVELRTDAVTRARRRLTDLGWTVAVDASVRGRRQRFAGPDEARLEALHRVAATAPSVALAVRGGYGLTRLLPAIDWALLARSVERGTAWVGYSDQTALQLGLLAHTGAGSWHGPMATDDFGRGDEDGGVDEVTVACFQEALHGELEGIGFRTAAGFDGLDVRGMLWGGNLAMVESLLGTPEMPGGAQGPRGGILFLEDVGEYPYRLERALLHLHRAGVLERQKAVLLGAFTDLPAPTVIDRGYTFASAVAHLRSVCRVPVLTGLPFGHVRTKVMLPIGRRVRCLVDARDVWIGWG